MAHDDDITRTRVDAGGTPGPPPDSSAAQGRPALPTEIGPYRVVGLLGHGGMGVVYEAEQQSPKRRVALKVVRGGEFVSEDRVRALKREAATLARLDHPNIGAIYESGRTEDGQHFFAMELVRGETLAEFLKTRGPATGGDELELRLHLFRRIAEAVHYAHQRGVIHRDLKPSNVIVAERELDTGSSMTATLTAARSHDVKILDFGLARITETDVAATTMATEVGAIKGTLQYMSPEQARGNPDEIDLRADVYALGAILYEMISGVRPYDVAQRSLVEAVRVICEQNPRSLSASWSGSRKLDGDLETIVGKAMEKDADRRYPSAAMLAGDVERYLTSQPILARPPSAAYQLRKFAARNRALVGGVVAVFVVLVAGVVVSTTFGLREAAQRRAVEKARADLEALVDFQSGMLSGVPAEEMGVAMLADLRARVVERARMTAGDHVAWGVDATGRPGGGSDGSTAANDAREADRAAAEAGRAFDRLFADVNTTDAALQILDGQILARASSRIDEQFAEQPEIAGELRATLATTYFVLGLRDRSLDEHRRSYETFEAAFGPEHRMTMAAGSVLGDILQREGETDAGTELLETILERQKRILGDDHPDTLKTRFHWATLLDAAGRDDEAVEELRELLDVYRAQGNDESSDALGVINQLALIHQFAGRNEDAIEWLGRAVEISTELDGPESTNTLIYRHNLALALNGAGRYEEAIAANRELLDVRRRVLGTEHPRTLRTQRNLAWNLINTGVLEEAHAYLEDGFAAHRRARGDDHPETVFALYDYAIVTKYIGRLEEAEVLYEDAAARRAALDGPEHTNTLGIRYGHGDLLALMGRFEEAEALLREVLEVQQRTAGPDKRTTIRTNLRLATLLEQREKFDEAETRLREGSAAMLASLGESDPEGIASLEGLAWFLARRGRPDEAEPHALRMLELGEAALGAEHPITLQAKSTIAFVRQRQERWDEAETLYREVLDRQTENSDDRYATAVALQNLACLYRDAGRVDEARPLFERADAIHTDTWGPDHRYSADNLKDYLKMLQAAGDDAEAEAVEARIRRIEG